MFIDLLSLSLRASRKLYRKIGYESHKPALLDEQKSNDLVRKYINSDKPCMIARFGYAELEVICTYLIMQEPNWKKKLSMFYNGGRITWDKQLKYAFSNNAGFFPATSSNIEKYVERVISDIQELDVLHSWLPGEKNLSNIFYLNTMFSGNYHPYIVSHPWTASLAGKRVLVISPFSETIKSQYTNHRTDIYENKDMLPVFELITLKAVQSAAGIESQSGFNDWFSAFAYMCNEINTIDFDIALIGAGSYGLSLASYIKSIGKKAVHTAGGTQLLFGIKGKRWENMPEIKKVFNQHWVYPAENETPKRSAGIEGGCYWQ